MSRWITKISILVTAGILFFVGQYLRGSWWPNVTWPFHCDQIVFGATTYCDRVYLGVYGWPLIAAGEALAIVGVILLFANARGLRRWLWTSLFFIPLAALAVWFTPTGPCLVICSGSPDYENMVWNMGYLYIIITLGIVLWTRWQSRSHTPSAT